MYKLNLLYHMAAIQTEAARINGSATINARTLSLEVKANNRYFLFQPQFGLFANGGFEYTPEFKPGVFGFIGWLPYFNKRWGLALEKIDFKHFSREHGLYTPDFCLNDISPPENFLIKKSHSSFGVGIRGPFRLYNKSDPRHRLQEGEFYEKFIPGKMMKIWYWNNTPTAVEFRSFPTLVGDGVQSVRRILEDRQSRQRRKFNMEDIQTFLEFSDWDIDTPIPHGKSIDVDFKYGTPMILALENENTLSEYSGTLVEQQLINIGNVLWDGIPESLRARTAYTVDATLDAHGNVQVLEMNCNPTLHPDIYRVMLNDLFQLRPQTGNQAAF